MRTIYLLSLTCGITFLSATSDAQENKPHKPSAFVAGGPTLASGKMKDSLFIQNGWNISAGAYLPLLGRENFSAGVEVAISYGQQKADGGKSVYSSAFSLQDGTITPAFASKTPHAATFQVLVGPKAEWRLSRVSVSPSFLLGYLSIQRNGYALSGTVANPKQPAESKYISFITTSNYFASGFALQPRLEIGYQFTSQLSLFAAGVVLFGPRVENSFSYWKPLGNQGARNNYSYDQFVSGAAKETVFNSRWQASTINFGLRYTWIKNSFDKGHGGRKSTRAANSAINSAPKPQGAVSSSYAAGRQMQAGDTTSMPSRLSMTPTTTRQTQSSNFGEKVAGGMQSGGAVQAANISTDSTRRRQGAVSSSYAAGRQMQPGDTTSMPSRLSMTPTTVRQTQSSNFGEKVGSGMQSGGAVQAANVSTDSTRRPQGAVSSSYAAGRQMQPGDTTSMPSRLSMTPTTTRQTQGASFGEKVAGGIQSGGAVQAANVSTNSTPRPQGAVSSSYAAGRQMQPGDTTSMPSRLSMTPTTTRQTQGASFGEKVAGGMQSGGASQLVAGQPMPGIVVKGGKNPAVQITTNTSNNKGEVLLIGLETGSYLFTLGTPEEPTEKNVSEKGLKQGGGIVVKGGKNPGGNFTNLTVNSKGQIGFEVLEAGDYKLIIEVADPNHPPTNGKSKKVVEKATSGLKDTLKTNV